MIQWDEMVAFEPNTGCWLWLGKQGRRGYGQALHGGRWITAHRLSYQHHKGEIPDGLVIDHICCQTCCVNPAHLEAVTDKENIRRGHRRSGRAMVEGGECKRGHSLTGWNVFNTVRGTIECRACRNMAVYRYKAKERGKVVKPEYL